MVIVESGSPLNIHQLAYSVQSAGDVTSDMEKTLRKQRQLTSRRIPLEKAPKLRKASMATETNLTTESAGRRNEANLSKLSSSLSPAGAAGRRKASESLFTAASKKKKTGENHDKPSNNLNKKSSSTKVMLLKKKRKRKNSGKGTDQELVQTYGGELVDMTDLAMWGEFEEAYRDPTGPREKNKMLKKAKTETLDCDEASDESTSDEDSDECASTMDFDESASDEDSDESAEHTDYTKSENKEHMGMEMKTEDDAEEVRQTDQLHDEEDNVQASIMEGDSDNELLDEMPFKGPLALRPREDPKALRGTHPARKEISPSVETKKGTSQKCTNVDNTDELGLESMADHQQHQHDNDEIELSETEQEIVHKWRIFPIHSRILKALAELKYTEPTEIQSECLTPAIRDRADILGAAETGSGKTLAFGIPLVHRLLTSNKRDGLGALILTPTRELAVQIRRHLIDITKFTSLHVVTIVGGLCYEKQVRLINKRPEIVVATPGRLFDLLQEDVSLQNQLLSLQCLVIDEADRMIQKGHFEEMKLIIKFMNQNRTAKRQNLVFSATLTMDPHLPERVIEKRKKKKVGRLDQLTQMLGIVKPKVIDLSKQIGTAESLTESRIFCEKPDQKDALLYYFILMHPGRTLVFCNSIDCVRRLKSVLETLRLHPMALHAEMQQRQRLRHLERFAAEPNAVLIATDVAARGLDIKNIEHVVHFNVSKTSETYIHRSGRTARLKRDGLSIMLIDGRELAQYRRLLHALKRAEDLPAFPVQENILKACKLRVTKARELEVLEHRHRKLSRSNDWFAKCAQEADIELDDDMLVQKDWTEDRKDRVKIEQLQNELNALLKKHVIPLNQRVGETLKKPPKNPLKLIHTAKAVLG